MNPVLRFRVALLALCLLSACIAPRPGSPSFPDGEAPPASLSPTRDATGNEKQSINDLGPLGSAARSILSSEPFTQVVVEIAHVPGRNPSDEALDHLKEVLSQVTRKPVGLRFTEIPQGDGMYSSDEIRGISRQRSISSTAPTASIWIAYLDGRLEDSEDSLGIALAATVAAIFPDKIESIPAITSRTAVERSVLLHEVGHLLALVNIGYESKIDHEDPEHPNHSKNRGSVMYWAVETLSVASIFRGGPPDRFDQADLADLDMLAGR